VRAANHDNSHVWGRRLEEFAPAGGLALFDRDVHALKCPCSRMVTGRD